MGSKLESHRMEQMAENVQFLESTGMIPERIAERLGVNLDSVARHLSRKQASQCEAQEV